VPSIQFYNDELNNTVTLHDMLSHRTGITRHDTIWYKSEFTRKELFDRLKYLEPQQPIRQMFLYNNMMYAAAGYVIELQSGKPWEQFVRGSHPGPPWHGLHGVLYSRYGQGSRPRCAVHREARLIRDLPDSLL
jgi:hypothetical protein